ncbi:ral guanine nucleotide dissociation stimulator-like [Dasypus novemcinctus]|uniref:ral guanine nucleotide dissociation stimulator-like n=1 Tax=Dasypus novemcinctus TaxID=9361 RepID=UPI0039C9AFF1
MSSQSSMQVGSEELEDGLIYSISLQKIQASHGPGKSQCWFQRNNNSTLTREENPVVCTVKAGNWEKLVEHLVPAFQEGDLMYINIFLGTYRVFTTTKHVLHWVFHSTLSSLLGTWLDKYPEDFFQPAASPCLKLLVGYAQVHLPGSALEHHAEVLLSQMSHPEPTEADPNVPPLEGKACLAEPPEPLPELKSAAGQVTPSEPSSPWPETSENLLSEEKANLLAFPPELVAQQLTLMDAELFKKVVPYHCLGTTWSQHNEKGQEHVAPTVCAVITQFNHVTNCVITTCLGDQSMKAQDRARVVEHWIKVARECQTLKTFSSLYAIPSALESQSIHRLKKTWEEVSRDSFHLFQMLSEFVSNENNLSQSCELIIKEEISKFSTQEMKPKRTQKKEQQKEMGVIESVVPCLGTYLTQFLMVDNAMQEYLEGRMVNFEKRRKENQMIAELQQLQAGSCYDSLMPSEKFGAWFGDMKQLSKKDSYHLSCELEPPSQLASKNLKDKHHLEVNCQAPDTESSGSSNPYSSFQLHSGDAADSPHTHEAGSSSSKVNIYLDHDLESQDDHEMKVSNQEIAPAVIHKAMEELNMDGEKPEDNKLVQIISEDQMLQIPDSAKVYYMMPPSPKYQLMLIKWTSPMDTKLKKRAISAFLGKKLKGPKF